MSGVNHARLVHSLEVLMLASARRARPANSRQKVPPNASPVRVVKLTTMAMQPLHACFVRRGGLPTIDLRLWFAQGSVHLVRTLQGVRRTFSIAKIVPLVSMITIKMRRRRAVCVRRGPLVAKVGRLLVTYVRLV